MTRFVLVLGLGSALACAAPFQNGSFEDPTITGFGFTTIPTGWIKFDTSCGTDNCSGSGLFIQTYEAFMLPALPGGGNQAFGFGGNGNFGSSLRQTFDTVAGHNYEVSFDYLTQQGAGHEDWQVDALDGSNVLATHSQRFNDRNWVPFTFQFTAGSMSSTLRFTDTSGQETFAEHASTNWGLDLVTVTDLGGPVGSVPEPASIWLASAGLAAVGLMRRHA
jgi:hypothetical protein